MSDCEDLDDYSSWQILNNNRLICYSNILREQFQLSKSGVASIDETNRMPRFERIEYLRLLDEYNSEIEKARADSLAGVSNTLGMGKG